MTSLPVSRVPFEKQTPIASLRGLSASLARTLGELGVGGSDMATVLAEAVEAKCILCRISVSGTDLISMGLRGDTDAPDVNEKLVRLRLGYCCRNGCPSSYYLVRFAPRPGIEWSEVWDRAQPGLGLSAKPAQDRDASTPALWQGLVPVTWLKRAPKLAVLGVVSLLVLGLLFIGGCRPDLLHKSRVFIVSGVERLPVDASVHGMPPFVFSKALGP